MKDQGVLVTGGAGFIGSNLVDVLMENGYTVYVVDDLSTGKIENLRRWTGEDNFNFIKGDIRTPLDNTLTPSRLGGGPPIRTIFHLAAKVDVTSSFLDPRLDLEVNYIGTMNVLDYAVRNGVGKVLFTSSAAVYGDSEVLPVRESQPTDPLSPYGLHKLSSENLIRIYHGQYGLDHTVCRLFNVYGPRQDPSNQYSGVISRFMEKARRSEPVLIYGDGEQTRDFVFVNDVARILVMAANSGLNGTFNVACGIETSVNDISSVIETISGNELRRVHLPERKGEIRRSVADISMLREDLHFTEFTGIREGLRETYRWFERQH
ncbi:MAG: NAD-dependent epimerase/dehydratase family protein [Candidatus Thermoplasmatota archaeon]|nr:NAD-dependent epimerase/dehydratase family protein [Candidatus Thermoplasmatota archaeon]